MRGYVMKDLVSITQQPLDDNEVTREIINRQAFVTAMMIGERTVALAKIEPVYELPSPTPDITKKGEQ